MRRALSFLTLCTLCAVSPLGCSSNDSAELAKAPAEADAAKGNTGGQTPSTKPLSNAPVTTPGQPGGKVPPVVQQPSSPVQPVAQGPTIELGDSERDPVLFSELRSGAPAAVGKKTTEPPKGFGDSPVAAQQVPAESQPFEEAFRAERIVWEPVENVELTTKTADGSETKSTVFHVKFKYDANGNQSIDTTGYKTYTWPSRQATFGPGAVIRITQNGDVREGAIRAGDQWTWTGQQWTAKPQAPLAEATPIENVTSEPVVSAPLFYPVVWREPASSAGGVLGAMLNVGTLPEREYEALNRRQERNREILKTHLGLWGSALAALQAAPENNQALLINLTIHDGLYIDDTFQPEKSNLYLKRMAGLAPATIEQWQTALAQSKTEAVWSLIQQEQLFEGETIEIASFERLLPSLGKRKAQQAQEDRQRQADEEKTRVELDAKNRATEEARRLGIENAKWRTWVSSDGIHRTEAKFVTFMSGVVTLEKKDGQIVKVPIDRLIEEDKQFIRERKWLK